MYKIVLAIFFSCIATLVSAQVRNYSGTVRDGDNGTGLPGVSVSILNTNNQTITDEHGEFSISAQQGDTIEFTFVGMIPQKIALADRIVLDVLMRHVVSNLDEVTVVAFGKQKKSEMVASVTTVNAKDLRVPSSNLTASFAGKIPGMISFQPSGEPGADNSQFFVRGVTTFGFQSSPLILIDGFESTVDNLARLQPDDIESFSIMKDALATVLYGARGANGIVIVNTKSGEEGPLKMSVRLDINNSSPTKMMHTMDGVDYMRMYNEARISRDPELGAFYSEQKIQSTATNENPMIFPNVDWYKQLFNKSTWNQKANINLSGGGKVSTYYVSLGVENETGLLKVDKTNNFSNNIDIKRYMIRSNVIFRLTSTTKLDTRIQGRFENYNGPYVKTTDLFNMVMNSNPVDFPAVYAPDSVNQFTSHILFGNTFAGGSLKSNPYAEMVRGNEDRHETDITAQATLEQDLKFITPGLKFQGRASVSTWSLYSSRRTYEPFYYDLESYNQVTEDFTLFPLNLTTARAFLGDVIPGRDADGQSYVEARFNWNRLFGKHAVTAMTVGTMQQKLLTGGNSSSIYETLPEKNMGNSGRVNYAFDNRYFAEFAYAYNGSEKFLGTRQFGFFPSVGAAWNVANEQFWEPVKDVINVLKLRASWGRVGNDAIAARADRFFFLSDISLTGGTNTTTSGYRWGNNFMNAYSGYTVNRYANRDITWETSEKINYGIEMNLLHDALKTTFDVYTDDRSNIYMQRENFPASAGLEAKISGNVGEVKSRGFETSVDYQKAFTKDFWISVMANFTYATNKIVKIDEKNYPDEYLKRKGQNINQQWGLLAERLFVDEKEIENSPKQDFGEYLPGDIKYKDINGDGVVNGNDRIPLGFPSVPEMQFGFGISSAYKNFDFAFFFSGNARTSFFIDANAIAPFTNRRNALAIIADDYWSETNPDVHAFWPRLSTNPIANNTQASTWWLRDGAFLRLKSVELGYSLRFLNNYGIKDGSRIYISGENILNFSSFKLWDPELRDANNQRGNGLVYPLNKRLNLGIQILL